MEPLSLPLVNLTAKYENEKKGLARPKSSHLISSLIGISHPLTPQDCMRDITFVAEVFQQKSVPQIVTKEVNKKVVKTKRLKKKYKPFASLLPVILTRLVADYLTVNERNNFLKSGKVIFNSLKQTNYIVTIPIFLQNLNSTKEHQLFESIQSIVADVQLRSALLTRSEKRKLFDQKVYEILKPIWQANEQIRNHEEISFFVMTQDIGQFEYVSLKLREKEEFILRVIKQNGLILSMLSLQLQADKNTVLMAVEENGLALEYAADKLKMDKEVALAAVKRDGLALLYVSDHLKKDKEVVLAAVKQDGWALQHASCELKEDKDIVLAAIKQNAEAYCYAPANLKKDRQIALAAFSQEGGVDLLLYASPELKDDKEVVLAAVMRDGSALQFASTQLQNDKEIVLAAVRKNKAALQYASTGLQQDRDLLVIKNAA